MEIASGTDSSYKVASVSRQPERPVGTHVATTMIAHHRIPKRIFLTTRSHNNTTNNAWCSHGVYFRKCVFPGCKKQEPKPFCVPTGLALQMLYFPIQRQHSDRLYQVNPQQKHADFLRNIIKKTFEYHLRCHAFFCKKTW